MRQWVKWTASIIVMLFAVGQFTWTAVGAEAESAASRYISVAYTVQPGDTLFGVARAFYLNGDDYARIAAYNGMATAAGLKAGATLILPNPIILGTYEVRKGDTLYAIAGRQFTRDDYIRAIMQFNGIVDPAKGLQANTNLVIPQPTGNVKHAVHPGDTLYSLSVRYFKPAAYLQFLAEFNGLSVSAPMLQAGQKLAIPNPYYAYSNIPTGASSSVAPSASSAESTKIPSASTQMATKPQAAKPSQPTQPAAGATASQAAKPSASAQTISIRIDLATNQLFVLAGTKVTKTFAIASGKQKGLTPTGTFAIITKIKNPYYSARNIPGGDPANPLGTRWMGLDIPNTNGTKYGIHGTNVPSSIGRYVSAGCIRMLQKDVEWLYDTIPTGTKVVIEA